uniref:Uncharacterized protein n=1 Tax=Caenorhabditis japonica TaxID=281687 RepID=A0A8R1IUQ7_CAEJA
MSNELEILTKEMSVIYTKARRIENDMQYLQTNKEEKSQLIEEKLTLTNNDGPLELEMDALAMGAKIDGIGMDPLTEGNIQIENVIFMTDSELALEKK